MTFFFDGGKVLRCEACGFRMYLGQWDSDFKVSRNQRIWWLMTHQFIYAGYEYRPCPCGGEMVETHVGRADGWVEIEAVAT